MTKSQKKDLSVAIVGAGSMAQQHAKAYAAIEEIRLVGIHSRTRAKAEALAGEHGIAAVFDTIDEMWRETEADLLLILVPELQLIGVLKQAVCHDWTLFLEKPAGHHLEAARQVRDMIVDTGRTAFVGLNRRFYSSAQLAKEELGADGPVRHIVVNDQQSFAEARGVGHQEEVVKHFMYANSIHLVDYVRNFGRGDIINVIVQQPWAGENSFVVSALIYFSSGDTARYEAIWNAPGPWSCAITTAEKRVEMRPLEGLTVQLAGTRKSNPVSVHEIDSTFKPGFALQAQHMVKALRGESHDMPDIHTSFEVMELIHSIYGV